MNRGASQIGVVAIGRNEGDRLARCLRSVPAELPVVYVDSASTDNSIELAKANGAVVVELDMTIPFTAARARNEGTQHLLKLYPLLRYIQFVDGDCELESGWIEAASSFLEHHPEVAATCGRRRERFPDASLYNAMCDVEWNTPVGEAAATGGDSLMRTDALGAAGGFDPTIAAGEEPELCARMRAKGWKIWRMDEPMTIHDADMHRFGQWWRRAIRSGFGYVQAYFKSTSVGASPLYARELIRAIGWTIGVPLFGLLLALVVGPWGLLAIPLIWGAQVLRMSLRKGYRPAILLFVGKFAETLGATKAMFSLLLGKRQGTIFYK